MTHEADIDLAAESSIAVIGMAGRFPGARNVEELWELLAEGREGISRFEPDELEMTPSGLDADDPRHVKARGILEEVEWFDASFFNVPASEARIIDPQHRVFLESCWWALEDAGYDPERHPGAISVYAGVNVDTYLLSRLERFHLAGGDLFQTMIGNEKDHLATRVAYKLGLRGESLSVQTACSTSLVAIHLACQSLLSGQSDMALAGGVSIRVPQRAGYVYREGQIASPDGHCRPFDAEAAGTVPGSGVGVVVLKPLPEALRDRDPIRAVIRGSAINNDGHAKIGYTAPSVTGQAEVIARAQAMADVDPETLGFVEAHGTGTPIGDPIEVEALTRVFRRRTERKGYCALGSIKSNIGHLDTAAGVAGVIKAVLALEHGQIPPTVHFRAPNPKLDLEESPFYVNRTLREWSGDADHPRRCAVSSFGIGGTNVHAVLEEAPTVASAKSREAAPRLVPLSARSPAALGELASNLANHLEARPELGLGDVAYTLGVGRKQLPVRRAWVAGGADELVASLRGFDPEAVARPAGAPKLAFLFSGQGSQSLGMAEELRRASPLFREHFERCAEILESAHGFDLEEAVYPATRGDEEERRLQRPRWALPALFALEHSLARTWSELGIEPDGLIGHSYGEYVAACVAGVYSLEDGLGLAVARGELMERLPPGAMLAVRASEDQAARYAEGGIAVATVNGEGATVLSGPPERIEALAERLSGEGVPARKLPVPYAYHSAHVEAIASEARELMAGIELSPPTVPFVSNLTGDWITADEATDPEYWVRQMRRTVRFSQGMKTLADGGFGAFLEIGPSRTLAQMIRGLVDRSATVRWSLPPSRSKAGEIETVLETLGLLWAGGRAVRWERLYQGEERGRVSLPGYPFERQRYWIEMEPAVAAGAPRERRTPEATGVADAGGSGEAPPAARPTPASPAALHEVDRSALGVAFEPPRDEVEEELIEIWQGVLGVRGIGRRDRFFDLGGDSLLATQVFSRVAERFPAGITLQDVLFEDTPAELAAAVRAARERGDAPPEESSQRARGAIEPIARDGDLPVSFSQEWLWSVDQGAPGSPAYNLPFAARVRGDLRFGALRAALSEIAARHEVLRSRYPEEAGRPVQRIAPEGPLHLPLIDLSGLPPARRRERLEAVATEEARTPFDLVAGPLFRARLVRLDEGDHGVLITMHHIVSDAWSMGIFARELSLLYPALRDGEPVPLPEPRIQYADFAAWQRDHLDGPELEAQLTYWKTQLAGAPRRQELPSERSRTGGAAGPSGRSDRGERFAFSFEPGLEQRLREVGRKDKATLFMVLLAGFSVLLYRDSSQDETLVGIPIAGRNRTETEDLIGCFINTAVIRTSLDGNPRFRDVLTRVRDTALEAYAHQDVPFERVVRAVRPQRTADAEPLVRALFDFQNIPPRPPLAIEGLEVTPLGTELATAKLDLVLDLWEREEGLGGQVEFSTDLFDAADIRRLIESFERLLADVAQEPDRRVDSLRTLGEEERRERERSRREQSESGRERFARIKPKVIQLPGGQS